MTPISKDNALATYKQIEISLRSRILDGRWPASMMLPSRRELAKEYGVSPITIERAITPLIAEGMLRADDRRGTFVTETAVVAGSAETQLSSDTTASETAPYTHYGPPLSSPRETIPATIGIVASLYVFDHNHLELNNLWVRQILQTMEQNFSEGGHTTRFLNRVQGRQAPQLPLSQVLRQGIDEGVDALAVIAFAMMPDEVDEGLAELETASIPVVCVTGGELRRPFAHVFMDNRSAGYDAATCLLRAGAEDILFFSPFTAKWVRARLAGARDAALHTRRPENAVCACIDDSHVWEQEEDPHMLGYRAARQFLAEADPPGSVIASSDGAAFGYMQAAAERGLTAGEDYMLVSFDDHPDALARRLTSLRPPMEAMGAEASRLLLQSLRGQPTSLQMRMRWHVISRASCRPRSAPNLGSRSGKESAHS